MAVTSIWPIKGRVDRVINYARNPEKTTEASYEELASLHAFDNVVEYAADDMKTERRSYVSCLNCREDTAAAQFMETKRLWGKLGGRVCYHGYQSFKADEVTAETAHEIGVKLAQELWGDRFEVVYRMLYPKEYMTGARCRKVHFYSASRSPADWEEWRTDVLASAILMPEDILRYQMAKVSLPEKLTMLHRACVDYKYFCHVAINMGVSTAALALRMKRLGILDSYYLGDPKDLITA